MTLLRARHVFGLRSFTDDFSTGNFDPRWIYNPGTWTIAGGKAVCTPTPGAELLTNGDLETWITATNAGTWTEGAAGTSTINQEATIKHGGSNAARMDIDASNSLAQLDQTVTLAAKTWYQFSAWMYASAGGKTAGLQTTDIAQVNFNPGAAWLQGFITGRNALANPTMSLKRGSAASASIYFDDVSAKPLTLSDLFASVLFSSADMTIQDAATRVAGCQAGVALNIDNPANPANVIIAYLDGAGNAKLDKLVNGLWTNVITGAVTYVAGAILQVIKSGTSVTLKYNGSQVGTTQTVSDATVISNRYHGMFSTNSGNSLDSFSVTR